MTQPIRRTSFTWDPDRESRTGIWNRIKTHVQQDLDRIHAEHVLDRREIIRNDLRWLTGNGPHQLSGEDRHPAQHGPPSNRQVDTPVPRTMKMMFDP